VSNNTTGDATAGQAGFGGGIFSAGTFTIIGGAITGNSTGFNGPGGGGVGGGIDNSGTLTMTNTTVSGNSTSADGGTGAGLWNAGATTLTNCTIVFNFSSLTYGGAGIHQFNSSSVVNISNTIVAGNGLSGSPNEHDVDSDFPYNSLGNNLIGNGDGSSGFTHSGDQVGSAASPLNALLGPLANNGGPTQTHALLAGSPALDAGNNAFVTNPPFTGPPFTDQRVSFSRIADGDGNGTVIIDIGAYERQGIVIDTINPPAGRTSGGQQIILAGAFTNLSTVTMGGLSASWIYTNGGGDTSFITVTTPAHAVGAVQIDLTPTSGSPYSKANAFAYLPTVFTDNTIMVGQTTAKGLHIIEVRQAIDALRAVAGLGPAPWTDGTLTPSSSIIKAIHILELRSYLDDAAGRLGYATSPYTDSMLGPGFTIKRIHIEELRQRIRTIAG
jgi:hypothetical protein